MWQWAYKYLTTSSNITKLYNIVIYFYANQKSVIKSFILRWSECAKFLKCKQRIYDFMVQGKKQIDENEWNCSTYSTNCCIINEKVQNSYHILSSTAPSEQWRSTSLMPFKTSNNVLWTSYICQYIVMNELVMGVNVDVNA